MADGGRRAPHWEWEEIVLVCDAVAHNQGSSSPKATCKSLSCPNCSENGPPPARGARRQVPQPERSHPQDRRHRHRASWASGGQNERRSSATEEVVSEFIRNPEAMHALAASLRSSLTRRRVAGPPARGRVRERVRDGGTLPPPPACHRERNPALRRKKISSVLATAARSAAKYASSTSPSSTASAARDTSNATTSSRCTSAARRRGPLRISPCSAPTATG